MKCLETDEQKQRMHSCSLWQTFYCHFVKARSFLPRQGYFSSATATEWNSDSPTSDILWESSILSIYESLEVMVKWGSGFNPADFILVGKPYTSTQGDYLMSYPLKQHSTFLQMDSFYKSPNVKQRPTHNQQKQLNCFIWSHAIPHKSLITF